MDAFFQRLIVQAATIDELLTDDFVALPGQKRDADLAARRIAAWCKSCASGDWTLFARRLDRDGLSIGQVLAKFATVRRRASASVPPWIHDAIWIEAALKSPIKDRDPTAAPKQVEPCAFEHLFTPVVEQAEALLWAGIDDRVRRNLSNSAHACLRQLLLAEISDLSSPAIYERFDNARKAIAAQADTSETLSYDDTSLYDQFIASMKHGGFRRTFEDKPVLLRLIASITRQWIDTSREFIIRLDADLRAIREDIVHAVGDSLVSKIESGLSDPHNGGHSVLIVDFEDNARVVYKPKDLRVDAGWYALVERLNRSGAPVALKAIPVLTRDRYGWAEFVDHTGCADDEGRKRFFRRAGAWLALFHCFAGSDMHQENMIAAGDHPVPIDLEMILQPTATEKITDEIEAQAFQAAMEIIDNSVLTVGLLPAYGRAPNNKLFAIGGVTSDWTAKSRLAWYKINSDAMRPVKTTEVGETIPNLPHVGGVYAKFGDHIDDFVTGFEDYSRFLISQSCDETRSGLLEDFAGLPVRKVIRPTRFYFLLLQRLRDHRGMEDGVLWSAQVDFLARLADWQRTSDPIWPLQSAERAALLMLNVPHFVSTSDGNKICDVKGISVWTEATPGLSRAHARIRSLDTEAIAWQVEVIRQNTALVSQSEGQAFNAPRGSRILRSGALTAPSREDFLAEVGAIVADLSSHAIRKGPAAAWIGLDWLGDSEIAQLVPLGADLYNGVSGIGLFLAAHAAVTGSESSKELALAAVTRLRKSLNGRNAARFARSLGTGGATGLGSIVYALAVMSKCLQNEDLLADAHVAAKLFSDDLVAADEQLDVMGGSAGGILGLLRLYRDSPSRDVLAGAVRCGDHLLARPRRGANGGSWIGRGMGEQALNGISHGAAGFAYALAALAAATGREDFARAASQCIAYENSSYDERRNNWPDFRGDELRWPCQWCHGAPGIGIARAASAKQGHMGLELLTADVDHALACVGRDWPGHVDTLCCGALGSIEFYCEAADALGQDGLREHASRLMAAIIDGAAASGDYRWNVGTRQFNLGFFRGLAGVGYTILRRVDGSLPNVLIWE